MLEFGETDENLETASTHLLSWIPGERAKSEPKPEAVAEAKPHLNLKLNKKLNKSQIG